MSFPTLPPWHHFNAQNFPFNANTITNTITNYITNTSSSSSSSSSSSTSTSTSTLPVPPNPEVCSLSRNFLVPRGMHMWDMIYKFPRVERKGVCAIA